MIIISAAVEPTYRATSLRPHILQAARCEAKMESRVVSQFELDTTESRLLGREKRAGLARPSRAPRHRPDRSSLDHPSVSGYRIAPLASFTGASSRGPAGSKTAGGDFDPPAVPVGTAFARPVCLEYRVGRRNRMTGAMDRQRADHRGPKDEPRWRLPLPLPGIVSAWARRVELGSGDGACRPAGRGRTPPNGGNRVARTCAPVGPAFAHTSLASRRPNPGHAHR